MFPLHDDNPTHTAPVVTVLLIVTCVLVFLWQLSLKGNAGHHAVYALGAIPAVLLEGKALPAELALVPAWMTLLTSMFMHGGWMHIIGNMLYLWIFGNNIEDAMGHTRFLLFYVSCGVVAALAHALPNADSVVPMIGASGAISGVLGAYLLLYPHARVLVVIPLGVIFHTTRLAAGWVLLAWFVFQLLSSALTAEQPGGSGVAWGAHIGGFLAGMALVALFKRRNVPFFARGRLG